MELAKLICIRDQKLKRKHREIDTSLAVYKSNMLIIESSIDAWNYSEQTHDSSSACANASLHLFGFVCEKKS